jgi:hypothetical protein
MGSTATADIARMLGSVHARLPDGVPSFQGSNRSRELPEQRDGSEMRRKRAIITFLGPNLQNFCKKLAKRLKNVFFAKNSNKTIQNVRFSAFILRCKQKIRSFLRFAIA